MTNTFCPVSVAVLITYLRRQCMSCDGVAGHWSLRISSSARSLIRRQSTWRTCLQRHFTPSFCHGGTHARAHKRMSTRRSTHTHAYPLVRTHAGPHAHTPARAHPTSQSLSQQTPQNTPTHLGCGRMVLPEVPARPGASLCIMPERVEIIGLMAACGSTHEPSHSTIACKHSHPGLHGRLAGGAGTLVATLRLEGACPGRSSSLCTVLIGHLPTAHQHSKMQ